MIRLELKNGEVAEIDLHERSITYRSGPHGLAALIKERREADLETTLAEIIEALGPGTDPTDPHAPVLRVKALVEFKAKVIEATGFLNAGYVDVRRMLDRYRGENAALLKLRQGIIDALGAPDALERIPISDQVRRLKNDAEHFRVMARDATAEREAWIQNAKAATGGKVENPRQLDAYIDGLKEKLNDIAHIVRDYVPPVRRLQSPVRKVTGRGGHGAQGRN